MQPMPKRALSLDFVHFYLIRLTGFAGDSDSFLGDSTPQKHLYPLLTNGYKPESGDSPYRESRIESGQNRLGFDSILPESDSFLMKFTLKIYGILERTKKKHPFRKIFFRGGHPVDNFV